MPRDLIQFPRLNIAAARPSEHAGPHMYMRYEVNGAVRQYTLPDQTGPGLPLTPETSQTPASQARACRIVEDVEQAVARNPRLRGFNPSRGPMSLQPKRYGAGLFVVPKSMGGVRLMAWPVAKPQPQMSLPRRMGRIFASSVRAVGTIRSLFSAS